MKKLWSLGIVTYIVVLGLFFIGIAFFFFNGKINDKEINAFIGLFSLITGFILIIFHITQQKRQEIRDNEEKFQNLILSYDNYLKNIRNEIYTSDNILFKTNGIPTGKRYFKILLTNVIKKNYDINPLLDTLMNQDHIPEAQMFVNKSDLQNYLKWIQLEQNLKQKPSFEFQIWTYEYFHEKNINVLNSYFDILYNCFEFVINEVSGNISKSRYINRIRSNMNMYELGLLFYYAKSKYVKDKKFKNWLEEYNFFEDITKENLIHQNAFELYNNMNYRYITP
jgi:hypothetical protein